MPLLAIRPSTRGLESIGKRGFRGVTDKHTTHIHTGLKIVPIADYISWPDWTARPDWLSIANTVS